MSIKVDICSFRAARFSRLGHNEHVPPKTPEGWDVPRAAPRLQR